MKIRTFRWKYVSSMTLLRVHVIDERTVGEQTALVGSSDKSGSLCGIKPQVRCDENNSTSALQHIGLKAGMWRLMIGTNMDEWDLGP